MTGHASHSFPGWRDADWRCRRCRCSPTSADAQLECRSAVDAPGHTDLMISPEAIDAALEAEAQRADEPDAAERSCDLDLGEMPF